nr:MAG TPA: Protein of unknown function (DUF3789) [Caudoviricetes sp.]
MIKLLFMFWFGVITGVITMCILATSKRGDK